MAEVQHSVRIDLSLDSSKAAASLQQFQQSLDNAAQTAQGLAIGGRRGRRGGGAVAAGGGGGTAAGGATTVVPPGSPGAEGAAPVATPGAGGGPAGGWAPPGGAMTVVPPGSAGPRGGGAGVAGGGGGGGGEATSAGHPDSDGARGGGGRRRGGRNRERDNEVIQTSAGSMTRGEWRDRIERNEAWNTNMQRIAKEEQAQSVRRRVTGAMIAGQVAQGIGAITGAETEIVRAQVAGGYGAGVTERYLRETQFRRGTESFLSAVWSPLGAAYKAADYGVSSLLGNKTLAEEEQAAIMAAARQEKIMSVAGGMPQLMRNMRLAGLGQSNRALAGLQAAAGGIYDIDQLAGMAAAMHTASGGFGSTGAAIQADLQGVSMGAVASYLATQGPGMGGTTGARPFSIQGTTKLYGANVDKMLAIIAASTSKMAEQGLTMNLSGTEALMRTVGDTFYSKTKREAGGELGRMVSKLTDPFVSAKQGLLGGFGGLTQAALQVEALSRSDGTITGIARAFEDMALGPGGAAGAARLATNKYFGGPEGYLGLGFSADMAEVLAGDLIETGRPGTGKKKASGGSKKAADDFSARDAAAEFVRQENAKKVAERTTVKAKDVKAIGEEDKKRGEKVMEDRNTEVKTTLKDQLEELKKMNKTLEGQSK